MIQLRILSGQHSGAVQLIRQFPFRIGRSPAANLRVEEPGVWEEHLQLDFDPADGIVLTVLPGAVAALNGKSVERAVLRNGDQIDAGAARFQFWLGQTRQANVKTREWATWTCLAVILLAEILLIFRLLR